MSKILANIETSSALPAPRDDGFSERLRYAMQQKGKRLSPILLEREFNLRWRGTPVSANSVRKWLWGLSIPTLDKLRVLAQWLGVTEDWLRWGTVAGLGGMKASFAQAEYTNSNPDQSTEQSLLQDYRLLHPNHKNLLRGMLELLLKEQGKEKSP